MFEHLIVDSGGENKAEVIELTQHLGIKRFVVSAFHLEANRMVEQRHKLIVDALAKINNGSLDN